MPSKIALMLAMLLTACGTAAPDSNLSGDGQARKQANSAESKATAPSPSSSGQKAEEAPRLTAQGWGPLKIGMSLAEITAQLGPDAEPAAVGGADPAACDQFRPARAPRGMLVMVEQGKLTRISLIRDSSVRTDRGIGLGDGRDAVEKAYGAAAIASPHKYVAPPAGYIDAWVGGGDGFGVKPSSRGIRYEIDAGNKVSAIHAGGPSIEYVEGCS